MASGPRLRSGWGRTRLREFARPLAEDRPVAAAGSRPVAHRAPFFIGNRTSREDAERETPARDRPTPAFRYEGGLCRGLRDLLAEALDHIHVLPDRCQHLGPILVGDALLHERLDVTVVALPRAVERDQRIAGPRGGLLRPQNLNPFWVLLFNPRSFAAAIAAAESER